jgi:phenylpyruvate tautomerase PptA (4-oxalocrotonate tautomerase family)
MALAQITTFRPDPDGRSAELVRAVRDALVGALLVPANDPTVWHRLIPRGQSIVAERHGPDAVVVEITMFSGRTPDTIAKLHASVAARLTELGIEPQTVLCVIRESPPLNWSIGGTPQHQVDVGFEIGI